MAFAEHPSSIDPSSRADPRVVWLRGEHDLSTVESLSAAIARAIAAGDGPVVLDLSDVEFMDASTLGVIDRAASLLAEQSRVLELRRPSHRARRLLQIVGLMAVGADPDAEGLERMAR